MKAARLSYLHVPYDGLEEAPQRAALPLHLVRLRSVGAAQLHLRQEKNKNRAGRPPDRCGPGGRGGGGAEAQMLAGGSPPPAQAAHLLESVIAAACWSRTAATGPHRGLLLSGRGERERERGALGGVCACRHCPPQPSLKRLKRKTRRSHIDDQPTTEHLSRTFFLTQLLSAQKSKDTSSCSQGTLEFQVPGPVFLLKVLTCADRTQ